MRATSTTIEPSVLDPLKEYTDMFLSKSASLLPRRGETDNHLINLEEGKHPPYSPLYNLSTKELEILRTYLDEALAKG